MAMSLKDFRQLEKMMTQTTSTNDAEALVALRMANGLLAKYNYTWAEAFGRLVTVLPDPSVPDIEDGSDSLPRDVKRTTAKWDSDKPRIEEAFGRLERAQLSRNTEQFINSLKEHWDERGFLTDRQKASLFKNADEL